MTRYFIFLLFLISLTQACIEPAQNQFSKAAPGIWRATLNLDYTPEIDNSNLDNGETSIDGRPVKRGELPFLFEVIYDSDSSFYIEIINGTERIRVDDIQYGVDRATAKDTIVINFPVFDSYIKAIVEEDLMEGNWHVLNRDNYSIPFVAKNGKNYRFSTISKTPKMDVSGKWEVKFEVGTEYEYPAIADFRQNGNLLEGTFLTETGDYRFLAGEVQDDKLYLSCFDGAHAFLFEANINDDESLTGFFRSGKHYKNIWEASKNENFELADPNELTYLKPGFEKFDFSFKNLDGEMISPYDEQYKGQPRIFQIFGSWCPNCLDETKFLLEYLNENPEKEIEIVALAFEKRKDEAKTIELLKRYKERLNIPYEIVLAGPSNKREALNSLPMLNQIISYPTLIFMDRKDEIVKIHTGFNGPATDKYETFKKEFEESIEKITKL